MENRAESGGEHPGIPVTGSPRVELYQPEVAELWEEYVGTHGRGTLFHSLRWKRILERVFGYRSCYLYASVGPRITGVLPLFLVRSLPFRKTLLSVPFAVYGGVCADDAETASALVQRAKALCDEVGASCLELRQSEPVDRSLAIKRLYVTFRRAIYDSDEKNMEAIPRKQRRMIRQGMKHGLQTKIGGKEDVKGFYHVYSQSLRSLGTPAFPCRYFEALVDELGHQCRIVSIWFEGKMVSAVMTFFDDQQVLPYYGGAVREYLRYSVNDFMYWELMRYAREQGCKVFDFGRSREGTGSYDFKRHWGFEPEPLSYQYYLPGDRRIPDVSPANPTFKPLIALWKRLPLGVTNLVGPQIIRYLP